MDLGSGQEIAHGPDNRIDRAMPEPYRQDAGRLESSGQTGQILSHEYAAE